MEVSTFATLAFVGSTKRAVRFAEREQLTSFVTIANAQ